MQSDVLKGIQKPVNLWPNECGSRQSFDHHTQRISCSPFQNVTPSIYIYLISDSGFVSAALRSINHATFMQPLDTQIVPVSSSLLIQHSACIMHAFYISCTFILTAIRYSASDSIYVYYDGKSSILVIQRTYTSTWNSRMSACSCVRFHIASPQHFDCTAEARVYSLLRVFTLTPGRDRNLQEWESPTIIISIVVVIVDTYSPSFSLSVFLTHTRMLQIQYLTLRWHLPFALQFATRIALESSFGRLYEWMNVNSSSSYITSVPLSLPPPLLLLLYRYKRHAI